DSADMRRGYPSAAFQRTVCQPRVVSQAMDAERPPHSHEDLIELEIAAFMGPHIKRARIALVLIGALYIWSAYRSYDLIAELRTSMKGISRDDADLGELKRLVDLAYVIVVFTGVSGVANIVLAAIAGKKTTFAI